MNPTSRNVSDTLAAIEAQERDPNHPRTIAREAIKQWRSNAQRESLPVSNQHDNKNAPVLDVDEVLSRSQLDHVKGRQ